MAEDRKMTEERCGNCRFADELSSFEFICPERRMSDERERFEAWLKAGWAGGYIGNFERSVAWAAWQAALASTQDKQHESDERLRKLAAQAVESQRNDKRTDQQVAEDGAAFICGVGFDDAPSKQQPVEQPSHSQDEPEPPIAVGHLCARNHGAMRVGSCYGCCAGVNLLRADEAMDWHFAIVAHPPLASAGEQRLLAALIRLRDLDINCTQEEDRTAWAQANAAIAASTMGAKS